MGTTSELCTKTITQAAELVQKKEVSPVELTRALLDRVEKVDDTLHSYITVTADLALVQAQIAEQEIFKGFYRGPLHGIPIAVKDLICTKGIRTTCGSKLLANWVPDYDASTITKLRCAGAILLGKLSMTEFAGIGYHSSLQPPLNPWNRDRWPGASSSGSGVATAACLCLGSLGSDTGGSIRFPSAACGIVGLKPTYGRVSRYGVFPLAESLDHVGPMTRSVADAAAILQVIAGFDAEDPTTRREAVPDYLACLDKGVQGLRIGFDEDYCVGCDPEVSDAVPTSIKVLEKLGAILHEVRLSHIDEAVKAWGVIFLAECSAVHEQTYLSQPEEYGPAFRKFLEDGFKVRGLDYARAQTTRQSVRRMLDDIFEKVDLLAWPTMGRPPMSLEEFPPDGTIPPESAQALLRFTALPSLTGAPAMSIPCGFSTQGLPIGLQIVGRHGEEGKILQAGHCYEQATEWHKRWPSL